jgi:hypothetical protein
MPVAKDDLTKLWVETWKKAGPALEAIRRRELREFRYEDHAAEIDALLELGLRFAQPRTTSGLVEQQRLFQKARHLFEKETG